MLHERLLEQTAPSRTLTEAALHYPLANPAVAATLPGASSLEQLRLNAAAAASAPLTPAELAAVRAASKSNRYAQHR
ncbi:Aldo/keto reductase family protein [compost metagenome]